MNPDYSNREIDTMFHEVNGKLDQILAQTTKTNGRVNSLEKWRYILTGGMIVIGAMGIPNVSAILKLLST
jgi:hypothetical protein